MSTADDKNETSRFLGEGVSFKAKLIGILEVSEARGDRMCQEALSDLKTAIRAAGEHKQRITINIAIDGLRLRDEKTGDSLYHHPVHKISFIAQDMTDSRAFGYIFGSPDTGHRFFGIKTDKAASQVVISMRDLFQVVFALKKREIELAKQHLDKNRYGTSTLFSDTGTSNSKFSTSPQDTTKNIGAKSNANNILERSTPAVADLVDLELELNSLQQGLNQMERITPSDTFAAKEDPFGDSFTPFLKPILPPPPSSGKDRTSRSSESGSLFSPKTPHTLSNADQISDTSLLASPKEVNFCNEFNTSYDETSNSTEWFSPPSTTKMFDQPSAMVSEQPKDEHEKKKQEILSQFDVFTELDPLGTGKIKPYVDKKHFFQELKNPPKKVLNDLVSESGGHSSGSQEPAAFPATFEPISMTKQSSISPNLFSADPFGEDPFVKVDPFAESDFTKQDPFASSSSEFGTFGKESKTDYSEQYKFKSDLETLFVNSLSKSPKNSLLEKQMSMLSTSPRNLNFTSKQNTFDISFGRSDDGKYTKMTQLHENPSLDLSSESECAPDPPPRPTGNFSLIKPPPLPPKKQLGEMCAKPPPRPPHTDDTHYDYMDNYESASGNVNAGRNSEMSPPLPVPLRKRQESDLTPTSDNAKRQFNISTDDEDYLTPVSLTKSSTDDSKHEQPILLPPPQRIHPKAKVTNPAQVTVASYLESKPNVTTSFPGDKNKFDGLDITLSELTLSGLNELAMKLNIPANQLSNMTLVQLTTFLSTLAKNKNAEDAKSVKSDAEFRADFANFNNFDMPGNDTFDRYAVFRELLEEDLKHGAIITSVEPKPTVEEAKLREQSQSDDMKRGEVVDKYAALRDIVEEIEIQKDDANEKSQETNDDNSKECNKTDLQNNAEVQDNVHAENEANIIDTERYNEKNIIEYNTVTMSKSVGALKSPVKKSLKSPIPLAVTDVIQNTARLTSGSLSDAVSGSSPEIDNNGSTSDANRRNVDTTGESWAIFEQSSIAKEKPTVHSEEGVSPWSSDSKEFGNGGSPLDWRPRTADSGSGGENNWHRHKRDQDGWWDTSAEPELQYYPQNRRSTDSFEDEYYDYHEKPRRRKHGGWSASTSVLKGGHSSSSRDVSPWEEEPNRRRGEREHRDARDYRQPLTSKYGKQHSFERHRDRFHSDSWDDEDDYEYEDEHPNRFHWQSRHSREPNRERFALSGREFEKDHWLTESTIDKKHRRRKESDKERWCCPDWDQEKVSSRYGNEHWSEMPIGLGRRYKHDEWYHDRESQESPWEDDYSNEQDESHSPHYSGVKTLPGWKRPSSASEMDKKGVEVKFRQNVLSLVTGSSDGERDRRYRPTRRSKSRDSQFLSDATHSCHKLDPSLTLRNRTKHYISKSYFDKGPCQDPLAKKSDSIKQEAISKRSCATVNRKKRDGRKSDVTVNTFPRKSATGRIQLSFESSLMPVDTGTADGENQFNFENFTKENSDQGTSPRQAKVIRQKTDDRKFKNKNLDSEIGSRDIAGRTVSGPVKQQGKQLRSFFEDDFSPTELPEVQENVICSIQEETIINEGEETFATVENQSNGGHRKKKTLRSKHSNNLHIADLKKSESVNIFARESDPFDDDFFSGRDTGNVTPISSSSKMSPRTSELKWSEQFEDFDTHQEK